MGNSGATVPQRKHRPRRRLTQHRVERRPPSASARSAEWAANSNLAPKGLDRSDREIDIGYRCVTAPFGVRVPALSRRALPAGLAIPTCNAAPTPLATRAVVVCRSRSGERSSASPFAPRARSMIGVTPATTVERAARRCAGVCIVFCATLLTPLATLADLGGRGYGGSRRPRRIGPVRAGRLKIIEEIGR